MSDFLKQIKANALVTSMIYAILGLVLLVWPGLSASLFCAALGVVLIVCGFLDIGIFLTHRDGTVYAGTHLVVGVILAVMGVYLMSGPSLVAVVIPRIVGILILIHGASNLGDAATLRRKGYERWLTAMILGALTLVLGLILVLNPFGAFTTVVRVIGAFLLYDGVTDFWITTRVSKTMRQEAEDAGRAGGAVDVDFKDVRD